MQQGELERCQISNTGLPLFSKHRQGNNMANSPPENFHRRCSPQAPIPHPSARLCVGPERWRCMHRRALRALRRTALQRVPNTYECCGTGHVHKTLGSLHFTVSYEVTTVARFKTLRLGKGGDESVGYAPCSDTPPPRAGMWQRPISSRKKKEGETTVAPRCSHHREEKLSLWCPPPSSPRTTECQKGERRSGSLHPV